MRRDDLRRGSNARSKRRRTQRSRRSSCTSARESRQIGEVLSSFGAELDDIARINTFYVGHGTAGDWARAAAVRGKAFTEPGPCAAGIPVPTLLRDGLTIRQDAIAMLGTDGRRLPRR